MPILLEDRDLSSDLEGVRSLILVPCRFCPAANLAVRSSTPYFDPLRKGTRTEAYEAYIRELKSSLERRGIRTDMFDSHLPQHTVMCMWGAKRRAELARRAADYDAVLVLGCDAAVESARHAVDQDKCRVIAGMEVRGIMNVMPAVGSQMSLSLEVVHKTPGRFGPSEA